MSAAHIY